MNPVAITLVIIAIAAAGWWLRSFYVGRVTAEKKSEIQKESRSIADRNRKLSDEELADKISR